MHSSFGETHAEGKTGHNDLCNEVFEAGSATCVCTGSDVATSLATHTAVVQAKVMEEVRRV